MRKLPPRHFALDQPAITKHQFGTSPEAQANAAFEAQLREANLKMPIKDAMRGLARQMQEHLDTELQKAVQRYLGHEITDPATLIGRLRHLQRQGEDFTTYFLDAVAVLKAGPQVLERRGDELHAYQLVEQLLPEDFKPPEAVGGLPQASRTPLAPSA